MTRNRGLSPLLNQLWERYHRPEFLSSDPLEYPHRFRGDPWDQEAVALLSALLAYGNVKQIRRSVEDALGRIESLGLSPRAFVEGLGDSSGRQAALAQFKTFVHRFNVGTDLVLLFSLLGKSWKKYGSLGAHFVSALDPAAPDFSEALDRLISDWRAWVKADRDLSTLRRRSPSFEYLLTAPQDGSCCKRWCMFLRWVGRKDGLDLGLWSQGSTLATATFPKGRFLSASQLVIPLDTHTGRISQYLSLTRRKSLNWRAALEVTASLRECDPADPVKYDFALARLGILDVCQRKYRAEICEKCDLLPACRFAARMT